MRRRATALGGALLAAAALVLASSPARADGRDGGWSRHRLVDGTVPSVTRPAPPVHRHFPHRQFHRPFFGSPGVIYSAPPVYYPAPTVPYVYTPSYAPALPSTVEYPGGRYELRGDGYRTPYQWVWVPDPPTSPPAAPPAPVPAPPPAAPSAPEPARAPARAAPLQVYCWMNDEGVATWTDQLESIPPAQRRQIERAPQGSTACPGARRI